ncbi:two-component system regulatory protein YycI [Metabacillus herbersteinensis]|uniref:Two-component system regulatory protein YycI n=1 Tax=Metabacillus herbersteinensis TaxID=283816 RepID=A0ABV6GI02_9BACI
MDWNKTKTIFIIAFLVLDTLLVVQFYSKRNSSNYPVIQNTPFEEQLAAENITYIEMPNETEKGSYITAKSHEFTVESVGELKEQKIIEQDSEKKQSAFLRIKMEFDKPVPLPESNRQSKLNQLMREKVLSGGDYRYWHQDESTNSIIYVQQYKGKMIFQNQVNSIGMIGLYVNDKNEIYGYEQTMLEDIKEFGEKEETIPAIKAVEALYNKNYLKSNSDVKEVNYGYYTQYPLSTQQILAPTWHIVVETSEEQREDFYVNALEGDVLQSNN